MSRMPRLYTQTEIYHVIMRGNNRQNLFYEDADKLFFIKRLKKYILELNIEMYGFCLMDNHVHMLIGKANKYLSLFVQKLANSYVYYFNHKYDCSGHLFQGRFKSEPVNDDIYFKTVWRYILLNPEKAKISSFFDYKWNSYSYSKKHQKNTWINFEFVAKQFSSHNEMMTFLKGRANDICMEYENKPFLADKKAAKIIKKLFDLKEFSQIKNIQKDLLISMIPQLKKMGISINQFSRITGIKRYLLKIA